MNSTSPVDLPGDDSIAEDFSKLDVADDRIPGVYTNPGNVDALLALFSHLNLASDIVRVGRVNKIWHEASVKQLRRIRVLDLAFLTDKYTKSKNVHIAAKRVLSATGDSLRCIIVPYIEDIETHLIIAFISRYCHYLKELRLENVESTKEVCESLRKLKYLQTFSWKYEGVRSRKQVGYLCNGLSGLFKLQNLSLTHVAPWKLEVEDSGILPFSAAGLNRNIESIKLESFRIKDLFSGVGRILRVGSGVPGAPLVKRTFERLTEISLVSSAVGVPPRTGGFNFDFHARGTCGFDEHVFDCVPNLRRLIVSNIPGFALPWFSLIKCAKLEHLDISGKLILQTQNTSLDTIPTLLGEAIAKALQSEENVLTSMKSITLRPAVNWRGINMAEIRRDIQEYIAEQGLPMDVQINGEEDEIEGVPLPNSHNAYVYKYFLPGFTSLTHIDVHTVPQFTYASAKADGKEMWGEIMRKNAKSLKSLKIGNGRNLEDDWLTVVAVELINLEELHLSACNNVTQKGLDEFMEAIEKRGHKFKLNTSSLKSVKAVIELIIEP